MSDRAAIAGLYAIADTAYLPDSRLEGAAEQAIAGGARVVQYRDKSTGAERRLRQAERLAALCRVHHVTFVVNDDIALAHTVGAGVHLGRDDGTPALARARLGADAVVGVSCYNDLSRAIAAQSQGCSYVAFGSFFPSPTKPHAAAADIALLRAARRALRLPIVAIGGLTPENGARLIDAGADALAVIAGLFAQPDVAAAARRYAELFGTRQN